VRSRKQKEPHELGEVGSALISAAFVERRFERAVAAFAPDRRQEAALACTRAMDRQRRQIAPNAKQKALAQLASLKQNGIKRSDQFQVRAAHSRLAHAAASRIA
jgi:hypothetical protein